MRLSYVPLFTVTLLSACASLENTASTRNPSSIISSQEIEDAVQGLVELKEFSITLIVAPPGVHYNFGDDYSKIGINSLTKDGQDKIINALKGHDNECGAAMIVSLYKTLSADLDQYLTLANESYMTHVKETAQLKAYEKKERAEGRPYYGASTTPKPKENFFSIRIDLRADIDKQFARWNKLTFSKDPHDRALAHKFIFDYFREPFDQLQIRSNQAILTQSNRFQMKYEPMHNVGSKFIDYDIYTNSVTLAKIKAKHPEWPAEDFSPQSCQINHVGMEVLVGPRS